MNKQLLFDLANSRGINDIEIYISKGGSTSINVERQMVKSMNISNVNVMSVRGVYNGKMGYAYTEKLNKESYPELLDTLVANAMAISNSDRETIFSGSPSYANDTTKYTDISKLSNATIIDDLK